MQSVLVSAGIFTAGVLFGAGLLWFYLRTSISSAVAQATGARDQECARLNERLSAAASRLELSEQNALEQKNLLDRTREDLLAESRLRAAAEEKCRRIPELETLVAERDEALRLELDAHGQLQAEKAKVDTQLLEERKASAERLAQFDEMKSKLLDSFKALSSDALNNNNKAFLDLAKSTLEKAQESAKGDLEKREQAIVQLVKPVRETLEKFDTKIQDIEKQRVGAYQSLLTQLGDLRNQTSTLSQALRTPSVRGRWGELQLKRVLELAGMVEYCDFSLQTSVDTEEGRRRPDAVVRLPGGRQMLIDAKVPLEAFMASLEAENEDQRRACMQDHARQIRTHITQLGRKAYWQHFENTPEFVVLFLPGENLFSAALQADPSLLETGEKVLLATPTTLIAVLRAVAHGWKEEKLARHAQEISELGKELHKRVCDLSEHWTRLGRNLGSAVDSYNKAVASMETRFLPSARKFKELEAGSEKEIEFLEQIETTPRLLQAELAAEEFFGK